MDSNDNDSDNDNDNGEMTMTITMTMNMMTCEIGPGYRGGEKLRQKKSTEAEQNAAWSSTHRRTDAREHQTHVRRLVPPSLGRGSG